MTRFKKSDINILCTEVAKEFGFRFSSKRYFVNYKKFRKASRKKIGITKGASENRIFGCTDYKCDHVKGKKKIKLNSTLIYIKPERVGIFGLYRTIVHEHLHVMDLNLRHGKKFDNLVYDYAGRIMRDNTIVFNKLEELRAK